MFCISSFAVNQVTICSVCHNPLAKCTCKCSQCGQPNCRTKNSHKKCQICGNFDFQCGFNHKKCQACGQFDVKCGYKLNHPTCEVCEKVVCAKHDSCKYRGEKKHPTQNFNCNVDGAVLKIDDNYIGKLPQILRKDHGKYTVTVIADGYEDYSEVVEFPKGKITFNIELKRASAPMPTPIPTPEPTPVPTPVLTPVLTPTSTPVPLSNFFSSGISPIIQVGRIPAVGVTLSATAFFINIEMGYLYGITTKNVYWHNGSNVRQESLRPSTFAFRMGYEA